MQPADQQPPIGVSLIEDDPRTRADLAALVMGTSGLRLVSTHPTAEEALERLPVGASQVALVDIQLPGLSGIECARRLVRRDPSLRIVMLTVLDNSQKIFESLQAGAVGYLLKRDAPDRIAGAVFQAMAGELPASPTIARQILQYFRSLRPVTAAPVNGGGHLSRREREIVELLADGYIRKEVADRLDISVETVKTHLKRVFDKLQVKSAVAAVARLRDRQS